MALVLPIIHDHQALSGSVFSSNYSGQLFSWGFMTNDGQLGLGTLNASHATPQLADSNSDWEWVSAGSFYSLGIRNGALYAWGLNHYGQLGLGDTTKRANETQVGSDTNWQKVEAGSLHSLGIRDGKLFAWGAGAGYRLGLGDTNYRSTPTRVGTFADWNDIAVSQTASFAIRQGKLYSWGNNELGQTGQGTTSGTTNTPTQVGSATDWDSVFSAGGWTVFGIRDGGKLYGWGRNNYYNLGQNDLIDRDTPIQIGSATDWDFIGSSVFRTFGIKNGELWRWGVASTSPSTSYNTTPIRLGTDSDWEALAKQSFGIRSGQLWNIDAASANDFVRIGSDSDWQAVSRNTNHQLAIKG